MTTSPGDGARIPGEEYQHNQGRTPLERGAEDSIAPGAIIGLSSPKLVGELRRWVANTPFHNVELTFRDPFAKENGPYLTVATSPAQRRLTSRASRLGSVLWLALARTTDPLKPVEDLPQPSLSSAVQASVLLGERRVACTRRWLGDLWAIEAHLSAELLPPPLGATGTTVTVAARGIELADVRLEPVSDLEPFLTAAMQRPGLASGLPGSRASDGPASFDAIQSLVLARVNLSPPTARYTELHRSMMELHELWASAHRAQMHFSGQDPAAAAQALMTLTEQMGTLAKSVPWWQEAGADAVSECVRSSVFSSDVRSLPAQQLWIDGAMNAAATKRWLDAWQEWYVLRPHW